MERMNQYYGIGAGFSHAFSTILAVEVIGGLGYYIYRTKKGQATAGWGEEQPSNPQRNDPLKTNKFEMD